MVNLILCDRAFEFQRLCQGERILLSAKSDRTFPPLHSSTSRLSSETQRVHFKYFQRSLGKIEGLYLRQKAEKANR